jgi:WhiB family transcriptional regulator, redox-sensing transcriptional regulator
MRRAASPLLGRPGFSPDARPAGRSQVTGRIKRHYRRPDHVRGTGVHPGTAGIHHRRRDAVTLKQNALKLESMNDFLFPEQDVSWQRDAACRGLFTATGVDLFFPPDNPGGPKQGHGVPGERTRIRAAKKLCAECPVKQQCLAYALANDCMGIWGGMTDAERRKMREAVLRRGWTKWNVKTPAITVTLITRVPAAKARDYGLTLPCALFPAAACMNAAAYATVL